MAAAPPPPRVLRPARGPFRSYSSVHSPNFFRAEAPSGLGRASRGAGEPNKALEDPNESRGWGWLLPPTPAHLLLSPGPRPSTSTLLFFPGLLRPLARGSESRSASQALLVQAGSSPSWACAVWRTHPHPRATLSTPRKVGGEGSEWPGVDKALCLPGHISPLSSVPPQRRNEPGRTPSTPDFPREGASPQLVMENSYF